MAGQDGATALNAANLNKFISAKANQNIVIKAGEIRFSFGVPSMVDTPVEGLIPPTSLNNSNGIITIYYTVAFSSRHLPFVQLSNILGVIPQPYKVRIVGPLNNSYARFCVIDDDNAIVTAPNLVRVCLFAIGI